MGGLTIGLAFGLAAAGGVSGVLLSVYAALANMWVRDSRLNISTAKAGLIGVVGGGLLGLAVGTAIEKGGAVADEHFSNKSQAETVDTCLNRRDAGENVDVSRNAQGQFVCLPKP